jgi:hypothetical protein
MTTDLFNKHRIPLLNTISNAVPTMRSELYIEKSPQKDNECACKLVLQLGERIFTSGFHDENDLRMYLLGMVMMKDIFKS